MPKDDCARFEESSLEIEFAAPRVESVDGDPQLAAALTSARAIAASRAARYERRRRLIPLLIGTAGYLLGAVGLALARVSPSPSVGAPAGDMPLPSLTLSLPPPSPAAVLVACAVSCLWIVGLVLIVSRRQIESDGLST